MKMTFTGIRIIAIFLAVSCRLGAQSTMDAVVFSKTFGGAENDYVHCIAQTEDGGYIAAGQTDSFGNGSPHYPDLWIWKLDAFGNREWERTYGDSGRGDGATCVLQAVDGGYVVAGSTTSLGVRYPSMWILKLDARGDTVWSRTFQGTIVSHAQSVQQTSDGGYIVAGKGEENILKLDGNGNRQWGRRHGWVFYSIRETRDGGYILAGDSIYLQLDWSYVPSMTIWKVDSKGNEEWRNPMGERFAGRASSVRQTDDGGYIVAGDSIGFVSATEYAHHLLVMKLDSAGRFVWKHRGEPRSDAESCALTADGGCIAVGNLTDTGNGLDMLIVKLYSHGSMQWTKSRGMSGGWEYASCVRQTADGGYVVCGQSDSFGEGRYDAWILKLDQNGDGPGPDAVEPPAEASPAVISLHPNAPNPFSSGTTIEYHLPGSMRVSIAIFTLHGTRVRTVLDAERSAGRHYAWWDGRDDAGRAVTSGYYICLLDAGRHSRSRTMVRCK